MSRAPTIDALLRRVEGASVYPCFGAVTLAQIAAAVAGRGRPLPLLVRAGRWARVALPVAAAAVGYGQLHGRGATFADFALLAALVLRAPSSRGADPAYLALHAAATIAPALLALRLRIGRRALESLGIDGAGPAGLALAGIAGGQMIDLARREWPGTTKFAVASAATCGALVALRRILDAREAVAARLAARAPAATAGSG